jgi:hypothetical protein
MMALLIEAEENQTVVDFATLLNQAVMGDDSVEGVLSERALEIIKELGHDVKEQSMYKVLAGIEFCSHRWKSDGTAYPVNMDKTLFRFFSHSRNSDQWPCWLTQLRTDMRHHPEFDRYNGIATAFTEDAVKERIKFIDNGKDTVSASASP